MFFCYIILLSLIISRHEPWFDEAQAWLLARDSSIYDMLVKYMRYEGSPALWHLILSIPAKLHMPYIMLNIISGAIACAGIYLFLRFSPFPPIIKIIYPFSFFAFYQYAVVARSYALLSLLLFSIAIIYDKKHERLILFVFLLALLANVSMHGVIISISLIFIHFIDFIKQWTKFGMNKRVKHLITYVVFLLLQTLLFFQLKTPSDIITFATFNKDFSGFYDLGIRMVSDALVSNISLDGYGNDWFYSISNLLFLLTFTLTLLWLMVRKKFLLFILPILGLLTLMILVYMNLWHFGVLFYVWLFALWVSYKDSDFLNRNTKVLKYLVTIAMAIVLSIQVYCSVRTAFFDFRYNYSASKEAAEYIKKNIIENKKIYMTGFHTIAVQPYFKSNIFCNYHDNQMPSFWLWTNKNNIYNEPYLNLSKYQPDFILMGVKKYTRNLVKLDGSMLPFIPGYKLIKCFDGGLFWKTELYETDSYALYQKM